MTLGEESGRLAAGIPHDTEDHSGSIERGSTVSGASGVVSVGDLSTEGPIWTEGPMPDEHAFTNDWLTPRETEVLRLVSSGLSAKEIGRMLEIAPRTVDRHIDHIRLKTRTKNRSHMIAFALSNGILP
jgi:DNA-binding CsgD family transcriptional regulator